MHHPKKCGKPDWVSEVEVFEQRQRLLAEKILALVTSHFLSLANYQSMHLVQLWQVDIAEQEALEKQEQQRIANLLQAPLEAITGIG
ncbi:hypothetical protein [Serratia oryzae]|uniref:Uncharacterized protein n=1 Tax=Serratia oryzae TaxID=2034155 RepID=A0A1S8CGA6_9GAMM|nr:hypothetical protein [Serratia oryzae]OMQ20867.1 hypothetical protein BMI79_17285 [Serratia oryzae]